MLTEQLDELIGNSDYASDIKSNYRGALLTRVKSLTVGLNKSIFTTEQTPYDQLDFNELREKTALLNRSFDSQVEPVNGIYGVTETIRDNGDVVRTGKNELGHAYREYYHDGKIYKRYDLLGDHKNLTTDYDDNGTAYSKIVRQTGDTKARIIESTLVPDTTIVKGNFTAVTDSLGRPVLNKITDLSICKIA